MSRATGMAAWLTGCDSMAGDAQRARRGRLHAVQGLRGGDYGHAAVLIRLCHRALRLHVHVLLAGQLVSAKQRMTRVIVLHMQITYVPCSWGCKSLRVQLAAKGQGRIALQHPAPGPDADTCWRANLQLDKDRPEVERSAISVSAPSPHQPPRSCGWQHVLAWELAAPGRCDGEWRLSNDPVSISHADERFMAV